MCRHGAISLFQNTGHAGGSLFVIRTNGEGTDATGSVITDLARRDWLVAL